MAGFFGCFVIALTGICGLRLLYSYLFDSVSLFLRALFPVCEFLCVDWLRCGLLVVCGGIVHVWIFCRWWHTLVVSRVCSNVVKVCLYKIVCVCVWVFCVCARALAPAVCSSCKGIASSHNRSIGEHFCLWFNRSIRVLVNVTDTRTDNLTCVLVVRFPSRTYWRIIRVR